MEKDASTAVGGATEPVAAWGAAELKAHGFLKEAGEGLYSARVHSLAGDFSAAELAAIAAVAERHGDGRVHLTSRQSIEVLGVPGQDAPAVADELAAAGLQTGSVGTRVRAISACLGSSTCHFGVIDARSLAGELDRRMFKRKFRGKFKVSVSGCPNNCARAEANDVGIRGMKGVRVDAASCTGCGACQQACPVAAIRAEEAPARVDYAACVGCGACERACPAGAIESGTLYDLVFGGRFGKQVRLARRVCAPVATPEQAVAACEAAFSFYDANCRPGERMCATLDRVGWDGLARAVERAVAEA